MLKSKTPIKTKSLEFGERPNLGSPLRTPSRKLTLLNQTLDDEDRREKVQCMTPRVLKTRPSTKIPIAKSSSLKGVLAQEVVQTKVTAAKKTVRFNPRAESRETPENLSPMPSTVDMVAAARVSAPTAVRLPQKELLDKGERKFAKIGLAPANAEGTVLPKSLIKSDLMATPKASRRVVSEMLANNTPKGRSTVKSIGRVLQEMSIKDGAKDEALLSKMEGERKQAEADIVGASITVLSPMKPSKKDIELLGSKQVITPVRRSLRNINHTNSHQSEAIELEKKHVDPQVEFWSPVKLEKQESCDDPNSGDTKENVEAVQLDKFLMAHGYAFKPNKVVNFSTRDSLYKKL